MGARHVKLCMETDHNHMYKFCMNFIYKRIITNMATVRNFEVMSDKFNVDRIST